MFDASDVPGSEMTDGVIVTDELARRQSRTADHAAENHALALLAQTMAETPETLLETLAHTALSLCHADSAGVSIVTEDGLHWRAVAGAMQPYQGRKLAPQLSPGGIATAHKSAVLMREPARRFSDIADVQPPMHEMLVVPFHRDARPVGTFWVVSHSDRKFDAEDARLVTSLSRFASAGVNTLQTQEDAKRAWNDADRVRSRLVAIVDSSEDAIVSKSLDGIIRTWNAAAERLFGYTSDEVVGQSITMIIPPDMIDEERSILQRLKRGERIEHFETIRVAKGGRKLNISLTVSPIRSQAGEIIGASKIARDITSRKQTEEIAKRAEQMLRESEERYRIAAAEAATAAESNAKFRTLFDQGAQFAGILTLDGTVVELNHLCLDACGFTREETIGLPFWECGLWKPSPELVEMVRGGCEQAKCGQIFQAETKYFVGDGSERFLDLTIAPVKSSDGRVLFLNPTGTDITEKKLAETYLKTQTERIRLLREAASVWLTTEEPDEMIRGLFGKIAPHFGLDTYFNFMVNDSGDALRLESCQGAPSGAAKALERLEFGHTICGTVAQTHEPITVSWIQDSSDPKVETVKQMGIRAYTCSPLLTGDRVLGTLSFGSRSRDSFDSDELEFLRTICRYVTVAYERLRFIRELREADRKKDDFIALLAHELRNPLAPIRTGLQILRLAGKDPSAVDRTRDMMDRQLTHMVRLIDDLLDVSRIGRNKMELRKERILLSDVVNAAVETARPLVDAEGHELTVSLPARPIYLDADLTRLAQVLSNLLSNSSKYTSRGGHLALSARKRGDQVVISVKDDGIGIPAESLERIFDMFSQVERTMERHAGGLGIGLALVKGLVEMHGGTVTAESPGREQGSTFTISLPVSVEPPAEEPLVTPKSAAILPSRRFLVVDDSRDGADSLAGMLRLMGNEVSTANDGIEAVEVAEQSRPDIVLMDVGMPRLNGLDAAAQIRSHDWGKAMKIIALTGWGQDADRARSRQAGCDGHLVKPVNIADLEKVLAEVAS